MKNIDYIWKELDYTEEEKEYFINRFAEMTVREHYILEGAIETMPITTAKELINILEQIYRFEFYFMAVDHKSLGEYIARNKRNVAEELIPFIKAEQIGKKYHDDFDGTFVEKGYVFQLNNLKQIYDGSNIDKMTADSWTVKIKVGSKSNPEGVWINLPDYECSNDEPDEITIALDALGTIKWSKCILLDAKCIFPNITDLSEQYDSIEDLLADANNFGYVCDEEGQGRDFFRDHLEAAMELEKCTKLDFALDISQNLDCYDFAPSEDKLEEYGRNLVKRDGVAREDSAIEENIDYVLYAKSEIEKKGLQPCKNGFIKSNEEEFFYEFSKGPDDLNLSLK